jgi:hypothetical protein
MRSNDEPPGLTGVQEPVSPVPFGATTLVVEHGPLVDGPRRFVYRPITEPI